MNERSARTALFWIFALSSVWESIITVSLFIYPEFEAGQFHGTVNETTIFYSNLIGGFMILFSALCWLCTFQLKKRDPHGKTLALMIGIFWVYIGIGLYLHQGAPVYVLGDTFRGAVIVALACLLKHPQPAPLASASG